MDLTQLLKEAKESETKGEYLKAEQSLTELIEQAQLSSDPLLAELFNHRGITRRMLAQYDASFADYQKAGETAQDNEQKALAFINMADIQRVGYNNLPAAHLSLDEALTYTENGTLLHVKAVHQRGLVFCGQDNLDYAIPYFKRAQEICERLIISNPEDKDTKKRLGMIIQGLCSIYLQSKDKEPKKVDEAYNTLLTTLDQLRKINYQEMVSNVLTTLGEISLFKRDADEAIKQYSEAQEIMNKIGYPGGIVGLDLYLAEAYFIKKEPSLAVPHLERFAQGVINQKVTAYDLESDKEKINRVKEMYTASKLKIPLFEQALQITS